jgi:hypothetical protein
MRDAAREATGGILIESTTDDPKDVIEANLFQPKVTYEQVVTLSHQVRPSEPGGPTEGEGDVSEERFTRWRDGAELRSDAARHQKNLAAARKSNPDFDLETRAGDELPLSEAARRAVLRSENSAQVYHFLSVIPAVANELATMHPHAQAVAIRVISHDLANGMPPDSSYSAWRDARNQYTARRRQGRNG